VTDLRVSVVIPVRNEAARIGACIEGVLSQTIEVREIVVVDSGSTDGTLDILAKYPQVRVEHVPAESFNHGESRNVGVRAAIGDWVALTVGDARPFDSRWLEELFAGLTDESIVAVSGIQVVPHERGAPPLEWFRPVSDPAIHRVHFPDPTAFDALTAGEKREACGWDNVNALYRRDVLLEIPFQQAAYCEDMLWAKDALRQGRAIAYNTGARVYHYHIETPAFAFRRAIAVMYCRYRAFGYVHDDPQLVLSILRDTARLAAAPAIPIDERLRWFVRGPQLRIATARAHDAFKRAMKEGDQALDALFVRHCGTPPVPQKRASGVASVGNASFS